MNTKPPKKAGLNDWHPADIKAALEKAGWTLRALAAHHGLACSTSLSQTFTRSLPLNERRIAEAIGVPVQTIWPTRYFPDGTARPRGVRGLRNPTKSTPIPNRRNGNTQQAA